MEKYKIIKKQENMPTQDGSADFRNNLKILDVNRNLTKVCAQD